jgi:hypothetical protein
MWDLDNEERREWLPRQLRYRCDAANKRVLATREIRIFL